MRASTHATCDAYQRAIANGAARPTIKPEDIEGMNAHVSFQNHTLVTCPMCGAPARPRMLVAHIQAVVAAFYRINVNYMWSAQRSRDVARPRQVAMYLARELTTLSLPSIGQRFGKRDHTTIMHGIAKVQSLMLDDAELRADIMVLRERLTADLEPVA